MFTFATKQSPITKLWRDGFIFYKDSFAKVWYVLVAMILFTGLLEAVFAFIPFKGNLQSGKIFYQDVILVVIMVAISFMINAYCIGVIFHRMYSMGSGKNLSLVKSIQSVCGNYLSFCGAILLVLVSVICGTIALVVPGIFLAYLLMFSLPLVICENYTALHAFKESAKLVWGNWWRTFCVVFPSMILVYGLPSLIDTLIEKHKMWSMGITSVLLMLLVSLLYAFILVQFNDLKLRKSRKP